MAYGGKTVTDWRTTWTGLALAFAEVCKGLSEGLNGSHIVIAALYALLGFFAKDGNGLKDPGAK